MWTSECGEDYGRRGRVLAGGGDGVVYVCAHVYKHTYSFKSPLFIDSRSKFKHGVGDGMGLAGRATGVGGDADGNLYSVCCGLGVCCGLLATATSRTRFWPAFSLSRGALGALCRGCGDVLGALGTRLGSMVEMLIHMSKNVQRVLFVLI